MPTTPSPKRDIGPIYQILAFVALLASIAVAALHAQHDHPIGLYDCIWLGVIVVLCICLFRPEFLDSALKTLADKIPFISYQKPKGD